MGSRGWANDRFERAVDGVGIADVQHGECCFQGAVSVETLERGPIVVIVDGLDDGDGMGKELMACAEWMNDGLDAPSDCSAPRMLKVGSSHRESDRSRSGDFVSILVFREAAREMRAWLVYSPLARDANRSGGTQPRRSTVSERKGTREE